MHTLEIIFLWSPDCWRHLLMALLMGLVPAILAWFAKSAIAEETERGASAQADSLIGEIGSLSSNLSSAKVDLEAKAAQITLIRAEKDQLGYQIDGLETEKKGFVSKIAGFESQIAAAALAATVLTKERDEWTSKYKSADAERVAFSSKITEKEAEVKSWEAKSADWSRQRGDFESQVSVKETELKSWDIKAQNWNRERGYFEAKAAGETANWSKKETEWNGLRTQYIAAVESRDAELSTWKSRDDEWKTVQTDWQNAENQWTLERDNWKNERGGWQQAEASWNSERAGWQNAENQWQTERSGWQNAEANWSNERAGWQKAEGNWQSERASFLATAESNNGQFASWAGKEAEWNGLRQQYIAIIEGRERELGDWQRQSTEWATQRQGYIHQLEAKDGELRSWSSRLGEWDTERNGYRSHISDLEARILALESAESRNRTISYCGKMFRLDDLKIIEGIGPKIEEIFHNNGVRTWQQLSQTPVERIREWLGASGERFKLADPTNWPRQAALAHGEEWDGLKKLQDELNGGREGDKPARRNLKAELEALKGQVKDLGGKPISRAALARRRVRLTQANFDNISSRIWGKKWKLDDHQIVEGIGPKIDELLRNAGILTWEQLSNTTTERIREILDAAGPSFRIADPTTWPEQARMADEERFEELKKWQDALDAGRA